jgi:hypothetical protein
MTEWPAFLLGAVSALVVSLTAAATVIGQFLVLPNGFLDRYLAGRASAHNGFGRAVEVLIGSVFILMANGLMAFSIVAPERAGGTAGVVLAIAELALSAAWIIFLVLRARGPRRS